MKSKWTISTEGEWVRIYYGAVLAFKWRSDLYAGSAAHYSLGVWYITIYLTLGGNIVLQFDSAMKWIEVTKLLDEI